MSSQTPSGKSDGHEATPPIGLPPSTAPLFDSLDMRLMHHFSTQTAYSLSSSTNAQRVWRDVVPDKAFKNHMLMHGVLSLAANHYVHAHRSSHDPADLHTYRTRGLHHQQVGLQLFRQKLQSQNDDQPHDVVLTFAATVGMLTFADANNDQETFAYDDALGILAVLRGKQALWRSGNGVSPDSDLAPAFFDPPPPEARIDLGDTALALDQLYHDTKDEVRKTSIALLKSVIENKTSSEFRILGTWPAVLSDEFLQLLTVRDAVAVRVLEHYCIVLHSLRGLWWVGDFGSKLQCALRNNAAAN